MLIVRRVREGGHDVGFAFDGDGDRVLAVTATAAVVDGDEIIAEVALRPETPRRADRQRRGRDGDDQLRLPHRRWATPGIEVATTEVGDRHVVEELADRGWVLGGEQSGHIIDMRLTPSGDGIAAALLLLQALGGRARYAAAGR